MVFDPDRIGIKEMEQALKMAGTYKETLSPADETEKPNEHVAEKKVNEYE